MPNRKSEQHKCLCGKSDCYYANQSKEDQAANCPMVPITPENVRLGIIGLKKQKTLWSENKYQKEKQCLCGHPNKKSESESSKARAQEICDSCPFKENCLLRTCSIDFRQAYCKRLEPDIFKKSVYYFQRDVYEKVRADAETFSVN